MENFIGINRNILNHWVYKDADYFKAWFSMLASAKYVDESKTEIVYGTLCTLEYADFIFGYESWSKRLNIGIQKLRTLMRLLIKDEMVSVKKQHSKFTVVNITNFAKFNRQTNILQTLEPQPLQPLPNILTNRLPTDCQHTPNILPTTNNIDNIYKIENNIKYDAKKQIRTEKHGEFGNVLLDAEKYSEYCERYGKHTLDTYIDKVDLWFEQNPNIAKKRKGHIATVLTFMKKDNVKPITKPDSKLKQEHIEEPGERLDIDALMQKYNLGELNDIGKP